MTMINIVDEHGHVPPNHQEFFLVMWKSARGEILWVSETRTLAESRYTPLIRSARRFETYDEAEKHTTYMTRPMARDFTNATPYIDKYHIDPSGQIVLST